MPTRHGMPFALKRIELTSAKNQVKQTIINDDCREVAERILRYLRTHPEAKDTLEGIAEWWLAQDKITHAVEQVAEALAWLVERGELVERRAVKGKTIYEVNTNMPN